MTTLARETRLAVPMVLFLFIASCGNGATSSHPESSPPPPGAGGAQGSDGGFPRAADGPDEAASQNAELRSGTFVGALTLVSSDQTQRSLRPLDVTRTVTPVQGTNGLGPATAVRLAVTLPDGFTPIALAAAPDGHAWYCDGRLVRVGDDDTASMVDGLNVGGVEAMVFDPQGTLWMVRWNPTPAVVKYVPATGELDVYDVPAPLARPTAIAVAPTGEIWLSGGDQTSVGRLDAQGNVYVVAQADSPAPITISTAGLAFSDEGVAYLSDYETGRVGTVHGGGFDWIDVGGSAAAPSGLAPALGGGMWFTSLGKTKQVGLIDPASVIRELTLDASVQGGSDKSVSTMTRAFNGSIWFSVPEGHRLGTITPAGVLGYLVLDSEALPRAIAFDQAGHLWVEDFGIERIDFGPASSP